MQKSKQSYLNDEELIGTFKEICDSVPNSFCSQVFRTWFEHLRAFCANRDY